MSTAEKDNPTGPWYRNGLKFSCRQCQSCCGGEPGFIWVTPHEIHRLAQAIGMDLESFLHEFVRKVQGRFSLKERSDGFCVLHAGGGCRVYACRPEQCIKYPFWSSILSSQGDWSGEGRRCQGIDQGAHHDITEIEVNTWDNI